MENQASLNGGVFHLSARLYQEWGVVGLPDNWEVQLRNLRPKQRAERLAGWMLEWANGFLGPSREITRRCLLGLLWSTRMVTRPAMRLGERSSMRDARSA